MDDADEAPVAASTPIVLTVAPTETPEPLRSQLLSFGGGLDANFQTTRPQPEDVPDLQVAEAPRPYQAPSSNEAIFYVGWLAGGGFADPARVHRFINCESTWHIVTAGFYLGLAQFAPSTWGHVAGLTGYWDWTDPWMHGYNTAYWWQVSDPTQQWPVCFAA